LAKSSQPLHVLAHQSGHIWVDSHRLYLVVTETKGPECPLHKQLFFLVVTRAFVHSKSYLACFCTMHIRPSLAA
jgi:hypothetical protein